MSSSTSWFFATGAAMVRIVAVRMRGSAVVLAVPLAASASLTWGVCDFLAALQSRKLHVLTVALLSQAVGFLFMFVALPIAWPGGPSAREAAFGLGAGLVGSV